MFVMEHKSAFRGGSSRARLGKKIEMGRGRACHRKDERERDDFDELLKSEQKGLRLNLEKERRSTPSSRLTDIDRWVTLERTRDQSLS